MISHTYVWLIPVYTNFEINHIIEPPLFTIICIMSALFISQSPVNTDDTYQNTHQRPPVDSSASSGVSRAPRISVEAKKALLDYFTAANFAES